MIVLCSSKSFSQTATATNSLVVDDSLVCFPQRYLTFIMEDLKKGDENQRKVGELTKSMVVKDNDLTKLKSQISDYSSRNEELSDLLDVKERNIQSLNVKIKKNRKQRNILIGVSFLTTTLLLIK